MTTDVTWSDSTIFSCPCGASYSVSVWRWVDVVARPELAETVLAGGPYEGECHVCGRTARAAGTWLRVDPMAELATLVMSRARRGEIIAELRRHLELLERRPEHVRAWMLQPSLEFIELAPVGGASKGSRVIDPVLAPAHSGELIVDLEPSHGRSRPLHVDPDVALYAGIPQMISSDRGSPSRRHPPSLPPPTLGAHLADIELGPRGIVATVALGSDQRARWEAAKLVARPILLRGRGYPLLGVRIVGAYMGQQGCIDGLVDAATPQAEALFDALSQTFKLFLNTRGGSRELEREISEPDLVSNARLCIQSAQGLLGRGEYSAHAFPRAVQGLAAETVAERLPAPPITLSKGAYAYVIGAHEAVRALEHLDRVSRKEHLTRLLEVEGFPVEEYESLRHRVLAGALEHGLVAPRRFWKRVLSLGLATDWADYAAKLVSARLEQQGEEGDLDLEPEAAREAWEGILELCERKGVPTPAAVVTALGLDDSGGPRPRQTAASEDLRARLRDPDLRLKLASDIVAGRLGGDLDLVLDAMEQFGIDELLAILADLSELGPRIVPRLLSKLDSPRRELRQSAAILLGISGDARALDPLVEHLVQEPSAAWLDMARAIGAFGPVALRGLCHTLRRVSGTAHEAEARQRITRAFAEIASKDGPPAQPAAALAMGGEGQDASGRHAVEALAEASDPVVAATARRALATLHDMDVSLDVPDEHGGDVRAFAQRAYEAIMVPEVEVEAEV